MCVCVYHVYIFYYIIITGSAGLGSPPTSVIISLAVVVPLLLATIVCYCTLRRKQGTNFKLLLRHQRHIYKW